MTYLWSTGATTQSITGLSAGTYSVTVKDENGCESSCEVTITEPNALSCDIESTDVGCKGESTGSATVSAEGGVGSYTYSWSNGEDTATVTGLAAGTYTVTVEDENGAMTTCEVTIAEPAEALSCQASVVQNVSVNGGSDGEATVTPSGGTGTVTYLWSTGATTQSITGLSAGTYSVTVTDENGCESSCEVTITEPTGNATGCETAYARLDTGSVCFITDPEINVQANRWGWRNPIDGFGEYTMDVYAAAGQCILGNGTKTAEVTVDYSDGTITFDIDMLSGFVMQQVHIYYGNELYPTKNNGQFTVANGQFTVVEDNLTNLSSYSFSGSTAGLDTDEPISVIVHMVTCEDGGVPPVQMDVTPFPTVFEEEVNLNVNVGNVGLGHIAVYDMNGIMVHEMRDQKLNAGENSIRMILGNLPSGMYMVYVTTSNGDRITKKIIAR